MFRVLEKRASMRGEGQKQSQRGGIEGWVGVGPQQEGSIYSECEGKKCEKYLVR